MRKLLFAAALSLSSVAIAQSQQPTQGGDMQPSGETVDDQSQSTGPQGVTQQGTDPEGQATAPAGANQMPSMNPASPAQTFAPRPAAGAYPPCSRTVTDACIQTYERGVRRNRPRR